MKHHSTKLRKNKSLFQLNRNLMITNAVLFLTVYFGMIFLIVLGLFQVVSSLIIASDFRKLTSKSKQLFITYSVLTISYFIIMLVTDYMRSNNDFIQFLTWIFIPVLLSFLHLHITYLMHKSNKPLK